MPRFHFSVLNTEHPPSNATQVLSLSETYALKYW
jgi:hypothetical protein